MSDDTENHTLRLLQEMREDDRQFRDEVRERFDQLDRIEAAVAGISYFQASERGEVGAEMEAMKARLDRIEKRLEIVDAPA